MKFVFESKLRVHQRRHNGYKCSYPSCEYKTDKWTELRQHLSQKHRKLECSICAKRYATSHNLKVHIESVHKESSTVGPEYGESKLANTFPCPHEDCAKSYERESSLRTHLKTYHCPQPQFICPNFDVCGRKYRHKKSLDIHVKLTDHSNPDVFKVSQKKKTKPRKTKSEKINVKKMTRIASFLRKQLEYEEGDPVIQPDTAANINLDDLLESNLSEALKVK